MARQDVQARDVQIRANGKITVSPANEKPKLWLFQILSLILVSLCLKPKSCKCLGICKSIVNSLIKIGTIYICDVAVSGSELP